jgi:CubicO group peptidase (beta-lactamase class C family)
VGGNGKSELLDPPLRLADPIATVVADLERYIPERMREARVPGLAVALIRDNQIVWTEGFGVANTLTQRPVTPTTVFEAASNGKVVAAYIALQLVAEGKLSLDAPLHTYLGETSWLPPSMYRDSITLRHLLPHSSGLSNNMLLRPKRVAFAPGARFRYSGVGFMVVQTVLETIEQQSIEAIAQARVFEPLAMASSSYVTRAYIRPRLANGHVSYIMGVLIFMVPLGVLFIVVGAVGIWLRSDGLGRPLMRKGIRYRWIIGTVLASLSLMLLLFIWLVNCSGVIPPEEFRPWNLLGVGFLCTLSFIGMGALLFFGGCWIAKHIGCEGMDTDPWTPVWRGLWAVFSVAMPLALLGTLIVPVPNAHVARGNVAYTLRATAPDLARLLIALPDAFTHPQVRVNADISWGLGIGIQHSDQGDSLWHWGANTGYKSLIVMYPDHGLGIVVLTNSDRGLPVARDIAQRVLGGKAVWQIDSDVVSRVMHHVSRKGGYNGR